MSPLGAWCVVHPLATDTARMCTATNYREVRPLRLFHSRLCGEGRECDEFSSKAQVDENLRHPQVAFGFLKKKTEDEMKLGQTLGNSRGPALFGPETTATK